MKLNTYYTKKDRYIYSCMKMLMLIQYVDLFIIDKS